VESDQVRRISYNLACFASSEVLICRAISSKLLHSFLCNGNISAPWVKFVKDILDNCGLSNVWTFQNIHFNTEWVIACYSILVKNDLGDVILHKRSPTQY
jgi:hypothetical protein